LSEAPRALRLSTPHNSLEQLFQTSRIEKASSQLPDGPIATGIFGKYRSVRTSPVKAEA